MRRVSCCEFSFAPSAAIDPFLRHGPGFGGPLRVEPAGELYCFLCPCGPVASEQFRRVARGARDGAPVQMLVDAVRGLRAAPFM